MKKILNGLIALLACGSVAWAATNEPPAAGASNLDEVVKALRAHYVNRDKLDASSIDAATVKGILNALGRGAVLVTPEPPATNTAAVSLTMTNTPAALAEREPLARTEVIEPNIGYIRVTDVAEDTVSAVDGELQKFSAAKCDGYILDLRFADGTNFMAAAELAGRFFGDERELFVLKTAEGEQVFKAHRHGDGAKDAKDLAVAPLILLVNGQTRGAAEALAGAVRGQDRGVIVGSLTAGAPATTEDIPLSDGQVLRVATGKVVLKLSDPKSLPNPDVFPGGITPDIYVPLDLAVEQDVVLKASTNMTLTVSLQPHVAKKRMSEADLVKAFRGEAVQTPTMEEGDTTPEESAEIQKVRDVVLQRAVDVLKGIRVLLSWQ